MSLDTVSIAKPRSSARRSLAERPRLPHAPRMPKPRSASLGEVALTATLLSIYVGARGTARALGAVHAVMLR
jgi:hypothetical protein